MKLVEASSFFKKVTQKQADANPLLAGKVDKKRPDLKWSYNSFVDAADLSTVPAETICYFLNRALDTFGRELLAAKSDDWDYVPTPDEITLQAAHAVYTTESDRSRVLTKESASAFAAVYSKYAPELLGIPQAAATAATTVLVGWTTYSKKPDLRAAMAARLEQFASKYLELVEAGEESAVVSAIEPHEAVMSALIQAFQEKEEIVVSADAL